MSLKIFSCLLLSLLLLLFSPHFLTTSFAKTIDEEINDISKQIADLENAIAPLKKESTSLSQKISSAKSQISKTENQITSLGQKIIDRESDLEVQKLLLAERIRRLYINTKKYNPLLVLLSASEGTSLLRQYSWSQSVINQDKSMITNYINEINSLTQSKKNLESEKVKLSALKKSLESRFGFLAGEIKKAEDYKNELTKKQQD